jgi:hypothetical protein
MKKVVIDDNVREQEENGGNDANQIVVNFLDGIDDTFGVPRRLLFPAGMSEADRRVTNNSYLSYLK